MISKPATLTGKRNRSGPPRGPPVLWWRSWLGTYFFAGKIHAADQQWEHAAQRAEQQHLPDAAGTFYALKAVHDALVSDCAAARTAAHRGLALDRSAATVPDAALALALCGEAGPALQETEHLASPVPTNTLANYVYMP